MKKIKGYLTGLGFIVLGVVIILFMFEHINKLYEIGLEHIEHRMKGECDE